MAKDTKLSEAAPGKKQWEVQLQDGSPIPLKSIVEADNETDAVKAFKAWSGIISTIHPILAAEVPAPEVAAPVA